MESKSQTLSSGKIVRKRKATTQPKRRRAKRPRINGNAPVAYGSVIRNRQPQVNSKVAQNVCRRELVEAVSSNGLAPAYQTVIYQSINPGNATLFPWLSTVAKNYTKYRFNKLKFEYVADVSTGSNGSVIIAPQYDPQDPFPDTEISIAQFADSVQSKVWQDFECVCTPADLNTIGPRKSVRVNNVGTGLQTYDSGNLCVGLVGTGTNVAYGRLYATYDVDFYIPQQSDLFRLPTSHYVSAFGISGNFGFASGAATPVVYNYTALDGCGMGPDDAKGNFIMPYGLYLVNVCSTFEDPSNEGFSAVQEVRRNNAGLVYPSLSKAVEGGTGGAGFLNMSNNCIFTSTGADLLTVVVTLNGSGGGLFAPSNTCWLTVVCITG